jgi:thiosulfate dehydrogenase
MANVVTAASFIHALMPIDRARQLSEQQAFDIASYINSRPRPLFKKKAQDYPNGGKPPGAG